MAGSEGRQRRATINDVAAEAGVSRAAVSKVYNGRPGIPPSTAQRIREAAGRLGWAPSSSAAALASASTRTIGMVISREPDLLAVDPHFAGLIAGIEGVLARIDYGLQLYMVGESHDAEFETYRRICRQRRVDGVLLTESRMDDPRYELLDGLGLPYVLTGRPMEGQDVPAAHPSSRYQGEAMAAAHLVELGHTVIAYVAGPEDRVHTIYRRRAFEDELARRGNRLSYSETTTFGGEAAERVALALMREQPRPTAIVLANDTMAVAAIGALERAGYRIPDDVSIVGHDDLPFSRWMNPRLTTIREDLFGLGRAAALVLVNRLAGSDHPVPEVEGSSLIVRESTVAPSPAKERR